AVERAGADDRPRPGEDQVVAEAPRPVLAVMQPRVGAGELERVLVVAVRRAGGMVDGHLRDRAERPIGAAPHEVAGDDDPRPLLLALDEAGELADRPLALRHCTAEVAVAAGLLLPFGAELAAALEDAAEPRAVDA